VSGLVARGLTNTEIAGKLFLGETTVKRPMWLESSRNHGSGTGFTPSSWPTSAAWFVLADEPDGSNADQPAASQR